MTWQLTSPGRFESEKESLLITSAIFFFLVVNQDIQLPLKGRGLHEGVSTMREELSGALVEPAFPRLLAPLTRNAYLLDAWVAQKLSISFGSGHDPEVLGSRLPTGGLLLPLPLSLPLSVCLS